MENITNFNTAGVAVHDVMPALRGILALQGIGLSGIGANGSQVNADPQRKSVLQVKSAVQTAIPTFIQDKPSASWHLAFASAEAGVVAVAAGYEPAAGMTAARLRTADQAIVIRNRQRCRSR